MENDLISRETLVVAIQEYQMNLFHNKFRLGEIDLNSASVLANVERIVCEAPSIEAEPVRHGRCELYCPTPVWMRCRNPETAAKPRFRRFKGPIAQYYRPEFTVEEPDWSKDPFEGFHRAVMEQRVKAIDVLDQKMVEACIQAAREEGVCLTLIDKKFIADAIREKMEREGLMNE